jgi:hypothetical protein
MTDQEFLNWVADRLVNKYGESPDVDFVDHLRHLAKRIDRGEVSAPTPAPKAIPYTPMPYVIHGSLTMQDMYMILGLLSCDKRVTVEIGTDTLPGNVRHDWHQIELSVIAAHERRVRGSGR